MLNKDIKRKALEIIARELEIPAIQLEKERGKTLAEFGISELREIELHFILADQLMYEPPEDEEMQILNTVKKTLAYVQLNATKRDY